MESRPTCLGLHTLTFFIVVVGLLFSVPRCSSSSSILMGPQSLSAFEKSFVPLYCLASIDDRYTGEIVWLKEVEVIADGNGVVNGSSIDNYIVESTFKNQRIESELNITDVTREHNGKYVCQLKVYDAGRVIEAPTAECNIKVFYLPTPVCQEESSFVLGDMVSILCSSDPGEKTADLKWVSNGQTIARRTFNHLKTIHTLYYPFTVEADDHGKSLECRTSSESFLNTVRTCTFGPMHITLKMSLEMISTVGDTIVLECTTNGNGDIQYTFYQEGIRATDLVTGNQFQININENDVNVTCQAVDSDSLSGSINITIPGKIDVESTVDIGMSTSVVTEITTQMRTTLTPLPVMQDVNDSVVGIAIGSGVAVLILIVCLLVIVCLVLRRKKQRTPKPQANDDLFLEEAFGRKKSLNVSFRKIQKRQSKVNNNEETITEDEDNNGIQFISERNLGPADDVGPMPDVVMSTDQANMAFDDGEAREAVNDNMVNEGSMDGSENSYTYIDSFLENPADHTSQITALKVATDKDNVLIDKPSVSPVEQRSTRALTVEDDVGNDLTGPAKPIIYPEYKEARSVIHSENPSSSHKINTMRDQIQPRKKGVDMNTRPISMPSDSFDGVKSYKPQRQMIERNSKILDSQAVYSGKSEQNYYRRSNSMPRRFAPSRPVEVRPVTRIHDKPVNRIDSTARRATQGVVNPGHKRTPQGPLHSDRRGAEQSVIRNKAAKYPNDPKIQGQPKVIRNEHSSSKPYRNNERQPARSQNPKARTMDHRSRAPGTQTHREAELYSSKQLPGRSAGVVVRNTGAKKNR